MLNSAPAERFSSRVENYVRFRPSYPKEVIDVLRLECGLTPNFVVADIASGTGLFTRLLLENGNRVFGVEPNKDMRQAGEHYLAEFPNFTSIAGTAESTTLPHSSADLITCAQAAHWLQREDALREFQRLLRPGHFVVILFNDRKVKGNAFSDDYEELVVNYGTDYSEVQRLGRIFEGLEFFTPYSCEKRTLPNYQDFDYESLEGRLLSSSYAPQRGDRSFEPMIADLRRIFEKHQSGGQVRMEYDTNIYFGKLDPAVAKKSGE
ncbi:MAG TPA: class I SAM-dependent methyltransferase [Terriglobales bacterium]|nr:class I SAM-dependent methyltransferase [Terriglobales bacterium]